MPAFRPPLRSARLAATLAIVVFASAALGVVPLVATGRGGGTRCSARTVVPDEPASQATAALAEARSFADFGERHADVSSTLRALHRLELLLDEPEVAEEARAEHRRVAARLAVWRGCAAAPGEGAGRPGGVAVD